MVYIEIDSDKEGKALVSLLDKCAAWRVFELQLKWNDAGGLLWEGLARVMDRGSLGNVVTSKKVVGKGRSEDLRAVREGTEEEWQIYGEWGGGVEEDSEDDSEEEE